jgi:Icc-related predicted phosphoesterase
MYLVSDLHLEFFHDFGKNLINDFPSGDLLFISGDLCNAIQLPVIVPWLCEKFKNVVMVIGNHELYNFSPKQVEKILKKIKCNNFHLLQNTIIKIDGLNIAGCTLWFPFNFYNKYYQNELNDFKYIKDFIPWVYNENKTSFDFLNNLLNIDIVITHHVPSPLGIAEKYKNSNLNRFFICDMTETILKIKPRYWFFGHTHFSFNFKIGETTLISNPRGYQHIDLNKMFTLKEIRI